MSPKTAPTQTKIDRIPVPGAATELPAFIRQIAEAANRAAFEGNWRLVQGDYEYKDDRELVPMRRSDLVDQLHITLYWKMTYER